MISLKTIRSLGVALLFVGSLAARDFLVEMKGAYFWATNSDFKDIYGRGGLLYGPEATVQLWNDQNWYAFTSLDYLHKKGDSVGLCDPTKLTLIPIALGLKYLVPLSDDTFYFYLGAGLEWVYARTKNCSEFVVTTQSNWGLGGIAKAGAFYHMGCNFLIDIFGAYSYAKVGSDTCWCENGNGLQSQKANVSGAILGAGLVYAF